MAAIGHTTAAEEAILTYLFLRNLKFLLKKPIVIATVSHSCFTHFFLHFFSLLPQAIVLLHLCRIESAAIPISEEKAMEWVAPPSRSLKANSKKASFPLFLKMLLTLQALQVAIHFVERRMSDWNKRNRGGFPSTNCRGTFCASKLVRVRVTVHLQWSTSCFTWVIPTAPFANSLQITKQNYYPCKS